MRLFSLALVALGLALSASFVSAEAGKGVPDISISDLKAAIADKKVTVIDVNGTDSFKDGHIPTASDFEASKDQLAKVLPTDKAAPIVVYCGGPQCGAYKTAAKAVAALGYTNVKHLSAGISGWKSAGEPTEKAS